MSAGLSQSAWIEVSNRLREAELNRSPIAPLSETYAGMTEKDAYGIQLAGAHHALRDGRRLVGYKVGLTSLKAQRHFNVFEPDFGHLFQDMCVEEDGIVEKEVLIQAKAEGEIAFVMGRELSGPGATLVDAIRSVEYVLPAIEIIDSRIREWKIAAVDTIADNGSSALFVLGGVPRRLAGLDLPCVGMNFEVNGESTITGAGASVLGNPLNALVFLANALSVVDRKLMPGEVVLSGSLGSMVPLRGGDHYRCEMAGLGSVNVRISGEKLCQRI